MPFKKNVVVTPSADKFIIRLPDGMRDLIADTARKYRRSMNSEIIVRLERSLARDDSPEQEFQALDSTDLSVNEQQLLRSFRHLAEIRQRALINLLQLDSHPTPAEPPAVEQRYSQRQVGAYQR